LPFEAVIDVGQEVQTDNSFTSHINNREVRRPPGGALFLEDEKKWASE